MEVSYVVERTDGWGNHCVVEVFSSYLKAVQWCHHHSRTLVVQLVGNREWFIPFVDKNGGYQINAYQVDPDSWSDVGEIKKENGK